MTMLGEQLSFSWQAIMSDLADLELSTLWFIGLYVLNT